MSSRALPTIYLSALSCALCFSWLACGEPEPSGASPASTAEPGPGPAAAEPAAEPAAELEAAIERAKLAAGALGKALKGRLVEAMGQGGPAVAIRVCADEAQSITAQANEPAGVRVGRASLRVRNASNEGPPWVRAWLEAQPAHPAIAPAPFIERAEGQLRFAAPILLEGVCLGCHGPPEALAPEIRATLDERYPADQATGYAEGDLRGAIWAEVTLAEP